MTNIRTTENDNQNYPQSLPPTNVEMKIDHANGNASSIHNNTNETTTGIVVYEAQDRLVLWQGVALLTADCMGVGILGLPNDVRLLGWGLGLSFLVMNCPINYYAGNLLSKIASSLEEDGEVATPRSHDSSGLELAPTSIKTGEASEKNIRRRFSNRKKAYQGLPQHQQESVGESYCDEKEDVVIIDGEVHENDGTLQNVGTDCQDCQFQDELVHDVDEGENTPSIRLPGIKNNHDRQTSDLINMTSAVFSPNDTITSRAYILLVKILYYVNLFLVLGDYILVMSRSVAAFFGEQNICVPTAGVIASIFMFGLCQFRTMTNLGRSVSLASLLALFIVIVQCLFHHRNNNIDDSTNPEIPDLRVLKNENEDDTVWGKFSSLAGIGFAVGSQKLFLNIRHELKHREEASRVLAGSLFTYGSAYVAVVLLAGPDPPSFLFDSIPEGWGRRIAGLLLWFHVAVSYAINSQALCASIDQSMSTANGGDKSAGSYALSNAATRWFGITFLVSVASYLVSNAVPFFKDLVALIGALTSVPLCLTLPAILYRKMERVALLFPGGSCASSASYLLLLYSFAFLIIGLIGALSEIEEDWLSQGKPFACRPAPSLGLYSTDNDPFREIDFDLELVEDCANNFGKYSVEEIEQCRDDLHAHRVQAMALGGETTPDIIKERFLETELTMQLDQLKSFTPEKYLFPDDEGFDSDVDTDIDIDGVLMDNGLVAMDLPDFKPSKHNIPESTKIKMIEELAEEGVLESMVICALLGVVMMAPKLLG